MNQGDYLGGRVRSFFLALLVTQILVIFIGAAASDTWSMAVRHIVMNMTLGLASGLFGGVIGFIFGIPRSLSGADGAVRADDLGRSYATNTNLEQISDWLTKVLVGATLASLAAIPSSIVHLVSFLDINGYNKLPGGGVFGVFLFLFFLLLGFYWSYVETRTVFLKLFSSSEQAAPDIIRRVADAPWEPGAAPIPEDRIILAESPERLTSAAALTARAAAETRAGRLVEATKFYQMASAADPGLSSIDRRLGALLARTGRQDQANDLLSKLSVSSRGNASAKAQVDAVRVYSALYKEPDGYAEAIALGEPLIQGAGSGDGQLHLWLACAYGQKLRKKTNIFEERSISAVDPDRIRVIELLEAMRKLRPDLVPLARKLWRPEAFNGVMDENDLEVLRDDPDVARILS